MTRIIGECKNEEIVDKAMLEKTISYLESMAYGKNPINNKKVDKECVLNDPEVIRCLFFAEEFLKLALAKLEPFDATKAEVIEKKEPETSVVVPKKKKSSSSKEKYPVELLKNYSYEEDKTISGLVGQLSRGLSAKTHRRLSPGQIVKWLKENGYLQEVEDAELGKVTITTDKGQKIGITHTLTSDGNRSYYRVTYSQQAQEFLVSQIPQIIN